LRTSDHVERVVDIPPVDLKHNFLARPNFLELLAQVIHVVNALAVDVSDQIARSKPTAIARRSGMNSQHSHTAARFSFVIRRDTQIGFAGSGFFCCLLGRFLLGGRFGFVWRLLAAEARRKLDPLKLLLQPFQCGLG
jgi:hypothetical protein